MRKCEERKERLVLYFNLPTVFAIFKFEEFILLKIATLFSFGKFISLSSKEEEKKEGQILVLCSILILPIRLHTYNNLQ